MAAKDAVPTKRVLASVWMTRTACPARTASRAVSSALYAAIPPLTPRSTRATPLLPVVELQLALGDFLEGDREVVLRTRVDHRWRELVERPLTEIVVIRVDLTGALGGHDHARVVGVHVLDELVDAGRDQEFLRPSRFGGQTRVATGGGEGQGWGPAGHPALIAA